VSRDIMNFLWGRGRGEQTTRGETKGQRRNLLLNTANKGKRLTTKNTQTTLVAAKMTLRQWTVNGRKEKSEEE